MSTLYPWQLTNWEYLSTRQAQQRLPQALLLTGAAGFGQLQFAKAFAKQLITQNNSEQEYLFDKGNHPDYFLLEPEADSTVIKIDQVRELQNKLTQTAHNGYRVAIIYPAHCLNSAASNALLKLVEEPNANIVLFFISSAPHILPVTLLSRCQKMVFCLTDDRQQALTWLAAHLADKKLDKPIEYFLSLAEDAPLTALEMIDSEAQLARQALLTDFINLLHQRENPVKLAEKWAKQNLDTVLKMLLQFLWQISRFKSSAYDVEIDFNHAILEQIHSQLAFYQLFAIVDKIYMLRAMKSKVNTINSQALLEDLFIMMVKKYE